MYNWSMNSWYWSEQAKHSKTYISGANAVGSDVLAKLTKHFCKITYRFIKLPVIFLHGWDPKHIYVPVDVLFKLWAKVNNCPISITENMGPERKVRKRQIKWEGETKKVFPERAILDVTRITLKRKWPWRLEVHLRGGKETVRSVIQNKKEMEVLFLFCP